MGGPEASMQCKEWDAVGVRLGRRQRAGGVGIPWVLAQGRAVKVGSGAHWEAARSAMTLGLEKRSRWGV